jgi:hypothetical protein
MKKNMYSSKLTTILESIPKDLEDKRIARLEERVRQLSEQVQLMAAEIALTDRKIRRQNTDIHNLSAVARSRI